MIEYAEVSRDHRRFLALTSLTRKEFQALWSSFAEAYLRTYPEDRTLSGQLRLRLSGGGRRGQLGSAEQKLLFILVYQKTYP